MNRWPLRKTYFWETAPFFLILLPFAVGILCYDSNWFALPAPVTLTAICAAFIVCIVIVYGTKNSRLYSAIFISLTAAIMFFGGVGLSWYNDARNNKSWFGTNLNENGSYLAEIVDAPAEKENVWKVPVHLMTSVKDGHVSNVTGDAFLYLYKDHSPMLLHKGDSIWVPANWQPIKNAGNPFEFDYAGYCRRNNLHYQQFCSPANVRLYATVDRQAASVPSKCHDWCMQQLDTYITDPKTKGLIQAMLLGDEVNLDEDLRQSYSDTGIIHIIAISGGNVGIFFIVISFLLMWLRHKKHLWVKYLIAIPVVWFYVIIAGSSPSAIRAAIMFSLLAFSVMLQKNNNSLNQLFATGFLLLCGQPMWLFSLGFQLSFVAVLSLILFYNAVYKWLSPVNKIAKALWATVAASIAAEVLVAPLVIYYFHTFPLLFIVANVLAYLFMTLVLILGIAIVALSWIPLVAKILGVCTAFITTVFDNIVSWLQGCSPESFHFLTLTGVELLMVYVVVTGLTLFLMKKQKQSLFTGLVALCVLLVLLCNDEWLALHQNRLVIYNTGKTTYIEKISGKQYLAVIADTALNKKIAYATKPAHINWRAWKREGSDVNEITEWNGKSVLVLNKELDTGTHFPVDYLVVNYTEEPDAVKLKEIFSPSMIITGNSLPHKQQDKLEEECHKAGIPVHSIAKDGALVLK